jgi:hypothetical protein
MTDFVCENKHRFHYLAKQTQTILNPIKPTLTTIIGQIEQLYDTETHPTAPENYDDLLGVVHDLSNIAHEDLIEGTLEISVCPECRSIHFSEEKEADVANVLVVEDRKSVV